MARKPRPVSSKKTKPNPELRPLEDEPGPNHNRTEEQTAKAFTVWVDQIGRVNDRKDQMVAESRNLRKRMAEDGFELADLNHALKLRKRGDDWAREQVEAQIRVAAWLGRPLGFQSGFDFGQEKAAQ
jgi:uncharacterized protein (UPF0335 family)